METRVWKKFAKAYLIFLALLLSASTSAFAQAGTGRLQGAIKDLSGALVAGASVQLQSNSTGVHFSTTSNQEGLYSFSSLAPAEYSLSVSQSGFGTVVRSQVIVTVDQVTKVDISLQPGSVNEVVTVTESSSLIETSNSTVGQLIGQEEINKVPLLTRNVFDLVQLSAGVNPTNGTPNAADSQNIILARPGVNVAAYTINGSSMGSVQFLLDGANISVGENGALTEIPAFQPTLDDVDEYRVETQNTPATYQSSGSGVISVATKSGTAKFHGDGFVYIRPNILAANDYYAKANQLSSGQPNTPADFHRYQEGGSFGGPLRRDKLFFFGDFEDTRQALLQTATLTVPTEAERTGDFSADSFVVYNPLVANLADGTRQPFPGNIIPKAALDPVATKIASWFPLPNRAGEGQYHTNNYFDSGLSPTTGRQFDVRIDGYPTATNHLFGRYSFSRGTLAMAKLFGESNPYDVNYFQNTLTAQNVLLAADSTVARDVLVQLRGSFTRHNEFQTNDPRTLGMDISTLGFPSALASEVVFRQAPLVGFNGPTTVVGAGWGDTFIFASENLDLIAASQFARGKHFLNVGFEFEKMFMNVGQPVAPTGSYTFDSTGTSSTTFAGDGSDFASFLIGIGPPPGQTGSNFTKDLFGASSNPYWAAYIQDAYQLTKTLTLNVGIRWELFGGRTERHNRLEYFNPSASYTINGVSLLGGESFADGSNRSPFTANYKDIAPRGSIAWEATPKFAVRLGAGINYGPSNHMVNGFQTNSDGFSSATTWNATTYNANGNTVIANPLHDPFPGGIVQPLGSTLGPATYVGGMLHSVLHSQPEITTYNFNLGLEYALPKRIVAAASYVGSRARFLPLAVDLNQLSLGTIAAYQSSLDDAVANQWQDIWPTSSAYYGQSTVPRYLTLESYPQFNCGGINCGVRITGYPGGSSQYDALQTKIEKHAGGSFVTLAAFTWGKLLTNAGAPMLSYVGFNAGSAQDWKNLRLEHAVSPQDLSYQFTWQASYELPVGKGKKIALRGWADRALGGWSLNTIAYLSSGVPIAPPSGTGNPYFNQRVDMQCDPSKSAKHTPDEWFSYACFAEPASKFLAGTAPAYLSHVRTNGAHDLDGTVSKSFNLGESRSLHFELSAYNVTNSVQHGYPSVFWNVNPTADNMAGFGKVTAASNTPRQFQFSSRFTF